MSTLSHQNKQNCGRARALGYLRHASLWSKTKKKVCHRERPRNLLGLFLRRNLECVPIATTKSSINTTIQRNSRIGTPQDRSIARSVTRNGCSYRPKRRSFRLSASFTWYHTRQRGVMNAMSSVVKFAEKIKVEITNQNVKRTTQVCACYVK